MRARCAENCLCRTIWVWGICKIRPIVQSLDSYLCKWLDSAVSNRCKAVLCPTVQWLDNAVSNSLMVGQCCVQLFNGRAVLCPTVHWLDSAVSNCPMVGQCPVQQSNGLSVLCPNVRVQWFYSSVSMAGQCCVFYMLAKCRKGMHFCRTV